MHKLVDLERLWSKVYPVQLQENWFCDIMHRIIGAVEKQELNGTLALNYTEENYMERLTSIEELLQLTEEVVSNRKDHRDKVMAKVHRFYPLPSTSENHASNRAKANSQPELEPRKLPKTDIIKKNQLENCSQLGGLKKLQIGPFAWNCK